MLPEKGWVRLKVQGKDEEGGRGAQSFSLRRISAPPTGLRLNLWDAIGEAFSFASRPLLRRWSLRERGKERSTMGSLKGERSTSAICRPAASPKSGTFFIFLFCFRVALFCWDSPRIGSGPRWTVSQPWSRIYLGVELKEAFTSPGSTFLLPYASLSPFPVTFFILSLFCWFR